MMLTKHTDYAFRVLIYLASMKQEQTTIQAIADVFGISKTHLMKIVNALVNKGWVASTRGKNGGIRLNIEAKQLSLKDIVVYMEHNLDPVNCTSPMCCIAGLCELKPILLDAQKEYLNVLEQYSLADLLDKNISQKLSLVG